MTFFLAHRCTTIDKLYSCKYKGHEHIPLKVRNINFFQCLVFDVSALIGQNLMSKSKCKSLSQRANEYPMSNSILMHVLTADSAKQIIKVEFDIGYFQWQVSKRCKTTRGEN